MKDEPTQDYMTEEYMFTFYGDPEDPVEYFEDQNGGVPPKDGDELCDGHQMHYVWENGQWV